LKGNSITDIHPSTFGNNSKIEYLDLSTNSLTVMHSHTFLYNRNLKFLLLRNNSILDISDTDFLSGINPTYLDLSGNRIRYLDSSVFRKKEQLETLILSENLLINLEPGIFRDCTNLRNLSLSANRISEIIISSFYGLENLEQLDLSNNNIEVLKPSVFNSFSFIKNRQNHQLSKLRHINLAQNIMQSFNFELYFPVSSNSVSSTREFQLDYLNVSSNRLTTLDVASVKWLTHTTAVIDLTANPRNCDCSVLLEVWRGLEHKLTLRCASPRQLEGKCWDVMEVFCLADDMNYRSPETVSPSTERKAVGEVIAQNGSLSVSTTTLIVTGVILVCTIGGGLILAKVVKRKRNIPNTPKHCDVYAPRVSYVSVHSYTDVDSGPSSVSVHSNADVLSDSNTGKG
jgi:hypothetical protein